MDEHVNVGANGEVSRPFGERRTRRRMERISSRITAVVAIGSGAVLLTSIVLSTVSAGGA